MATEQIHRFELDGKRYAIDPETCFCFACDEVSWDVLEYYPETTTNRIHHLLDGKHPPREIDEVVSELEWLRSTKSILPPIDIKEFPKRFEVDGGLKSISIELPSGAGAKKPGWFERGGDRTLEQEAQYAFDAINLLLARSGTNSELEVEFCQTGSLTNPELIEDLCAYALRAASLAGKKLSAALRIDNIDPAKAPTELKGHELAIRMEFSDINVLAPQLKALEGLAKASFPKWPKLLQPAVPGAKGRIILAPRSPEFPQAVKELHKAGFLHIELDLEDAFIASGIEQDVIFEGLSQTAIDYANSLLKHDYFRLDPIAGLFYRIHNGTPLKRQDPSGTNELAVDKQGNVFPSRRFLGLDDFKLGALKSGQLDEDLIGRFEDVGVVTTPVCLKCWARSLCGGGCAAVHQHLSGSFREPLQEWCDAQRAWCAAAVSAFNLLASQGVNFNRVYGNLSPTKKPSIFTMARAAFRMNIGMRPIEEADAKLLTSWENWSDAAYFLYNESGLFMATNYDREMDAIHPRGIEQEMILVRKNGDPIGLIKIRPEGAPGTAMAWLYMHNKDDYAAQPIRKSFQFMLKEASGQQGLNKLAVPAATHEKGLIAFLEAIGFKKAGKVREGLYLHGTYRDILIYEAATSKL